MPQAKKRFTKTTLPSKPCQHCGLPMQWRKSWEKNWNEVKYCSDRCRKDARRNSSKSPVLSKQ